MGARSDGCTSCKTRRVKCDEKKPTCQRCRSAGIQCRGYGSKFLFVDDTTRVRRKVKTRDRQQEQFSGFRNSANESWILGNETLLTTTPVRQPALTGVMRETIYLSFLARKMSDETVADGPILHVRQSSLVSHLAIYALAALVFGQAHQSDQIIVESRHVYGQALLGLQADIADPRKAMSFYTSESVAALCMYEVSHMCHSRITYSLICGVLIVAHQRHGIITQMDLPN